MQDHRRAKARAHAIREANVGNAFALGLGAFAILVLMLFVVNGVG